MAEEIRTAAELDALPVGSILVLPDDPAWTLTRGAYTDGRPWGGSDGERWSSDAAVLNGFTLLYRPDAPQPTPAPDLRGSLDLALHTIQRQIDDILSILGEDAASVTVDGEVNLDLLWEMLAAGYVPVAKRAPQPTPVGDEHRAALAAARAGEAEQVDREALAEAHLCDQSYPVRFPGGDFEVQAVPLYVAEEAVQMALLAARGDAAVPSVTASPADEVRSVCGKDVRGTVPSWAGEDQIDPCTCVLPPGHDEPCKCSHEVTP